MSKRKVTKLVHRSGEKSYSQKAAVYFAYMKAHPDMSRTKVYKHYEGTPYGIRKQDFFPLADNLKEAIKYGKALDNSDMINMKSKKELKATAYQYAKKSTVRYKKENPLKPGVIQPTVYDLVSNTMAKDDNLARYEDGDTVEFYGGSFDDEDDGDEIKVIIPHMDYEDYD